MSRLRRVFSVGFLSAVLLVSCAQPSPTPPEPISPSKTPEPISPSETPEITESASPPTATTIPTEQPSVTETADVIFHNGTILTMEDELPTAQAIAIKGDVILAVGDDADILAYSDPETQVVDLQGHTVMPGFVDAHSHLLNDAGSASMGLDQAQQQALEYGITSFADMFTSEAFLAEMRAYEQEGKLHMRTSLYLAYTDPCGVVQGDWYKQYPSTHEPGEMLRVGGVKLFADGGVCGKLALSTGYPDGGNGDLWFTQDELNRTVAEIQNAGYQVAIHAQGDLAIEQAQNAIAFALDGAPNIYRHRIEHNPLARPDLLPRYSELGIIPIAWGEYPTCAEVNEGFYSSYFGEEPMPWLENWRTFLDANPNLPVAWHSDFPYASLNPIVHLYSYVTRQEVAEDGTVCMPPDWLAAHRITVDEALPMMTINAAYALFREEEVGSLKAGKYADLIVISDNPTTVNPNDIINIQVWMTMVGGRAEFCADGHAELCPQTEATASSAPETGSTSQADISASASNSRAGHAPALAFDGLANGDSFWSSGDDAPQWIRVDFLEPVTLTEARFVVFQNPPGDTVHTLEALVNGEWVLVETYRSFTTTGDVITWRPPTPVADVSAMRMTTLESPSWPEWYEIKIDTTEE